MQPSSHTKRLRLTVNTTLSGAPCVFFWIALLSISTPFQSTATLAFENFFRSVHSQGTNSDDGVMRAWTCHGRNQRDLVDRLRQANIVKTPSVQKVLQQVDRANFVPIDPYMDAPQMIGMGQTISAPHMHAHVLEEMYPALRGKDHVTVLDVGCGSGYLTAALGRWVHGRRGNGDDVDVRDGDGDTNSILGATSGKVFGIDVHRHLVDLSRENIMREDGDLIDDGVVHLSVRDGWGGIPEEAPFDAIHVGAAADSMPIQLAQQLKLGGVMIIPIGRQNEAQTLYKVERIKQGVPSESETFHPQDFHITTLLGVRYVPLVHVQNN